MANNIILKFVPFTTACFWMFALSAIALFTRSRLLVPPWDRNSVNECKESIAFNYWRSLNSSREAVGEVGWQNLLEIAEKLKINLSVTHTRNCRFIRKSGKFVYTYRFVV